MAITGDTQKLIKRIEALKVTAEVLIAEVKDLREIAKALINELKKTSEAKNPETLSG
ncbi:MAG TPA: hypothetical protein VG013_34140 [Gemmataceae bacterium]|nr:hypothetical protein [Gemmataceae bacterium]